MARTAVIVIGGAGIDHRVLAQLPGDRYVIAADIGLDHALALGLTVDLLVGDLDSVSDAGRRRRSAPAWRSSTIVRDKDATDTELAIAGDLEGIPRSGGRVGRTGGGERLDHELAGSCPSPDRTSGPSGRGLVGPGPLAVVHGPGSAPVEAAPGDRVAAPRPRGRRRRDDDRPRLPAR